MLDNNTNKVVWVGVAVGVVALMGAGALTLFPDAFSGMKNTISSVMTTKANADKNNQDTSKGVTDDESTTIFKYGNFNKDAKTVEIQGFDESKPDWDKYSRDLTIPSEYVKDGVTYRVVSVGDSAFYTNKLTSVTIPDSVRIIREWAFARNQLTSVTIPNSVTTISLCTFAGNKLTSVTIPNSVTRIGGSAFDTNQLTSVTIPNSVTTIDDGAFANNQLISVTIPNSVTSIGMNAFQNNNLTSVTIPNSVTSIDKWAFSINKLTSVTVPNTVTSLGDDVFDSTVKINR